MKRADTSTSPASGMGKRNGARGEVTPVPALEPLLPLAGRWKTVINWSQDTHKLVGGPASIAGEARFTWLEDGRFLHYEFGPSHWLMGRDDTSREYCVLYGDDRKVSRIYQMTLSRGVWRMWRDAPSFSQRFEGRFKDNGRTIRASWERSTNRKKWIHDFDLTYTKIE